jgi:hypothetical protein
MPKYSPEEIAAGISRLLPELPQLLLPDQAQALQGQLEALLEKARIPEELPAAVTQGLEAVNPHDAVRQRLKHLLEEMTGKKGETRLGFEAAPGSGQPIPLGTSMVCPKDPKHWQDDLRIQGERCPVCNAPLVPVETVVKNSTADQ